MADESQVAILKRGVREWNSWRATSEVRHPDLRGAYISESSMAWARQDLTPPLFVNARLAKINLNGALLDDVILKGASLRDADLLGASLMRADLRRADFRGADLRFAKLNRADLTLANLSRAKVGNALFWETIIARTKLAGAVNLDHCKHGGPSVIDHRTVARSGALPRVFLEGCGIPDSLIKIFDKIVRDSLALSSVFISYTTVDEPFATRLHRDLQNNGVRCWFAEHDVLPGKKLHEQIDEAIRVYDRLLLILSDASMSSEWVKTEIAKALQKQRRSGRHVLFPIALVPFAHLRAWENFDADIGKDSAREIREYFIPDFTGWDKDHSVYKEAFDKLLKGLKAEDKAPEAK